MTMALSKHGSFYRGDDKTEKIFVGDESLMSTRSVHFKSPFVFEHIVPSRDCIVCCMIAVFPVGKFAARKSAIPYLSIIFVASLVIILGHACSTLNFEPVRQGTS